MQLRDEKIHLEHFLTANQVEKIMGTIFSLDADCRSKETHIVELR